MAKRELLGESFRWDHDDIDKASRKELWNMDLILREKIAQTRRLLYRVRKRIKADYKAYAAKESKV